jgi:hypothetical protein
MVLGTDRPDPKLVELRFSNPTPLETLTFTTTSVDRDSDGRDDVAIEMTLHTGDDERAASTQFVWLDRPTGRARETGITSDAFQAIGSIEVVRSKGKKTGRGVAPRIQNARRLFGAVCGESRTALVKLADGSPLSCEVSAQAFDFYAQAEVQAALTLGLPEEALFAFELGDEFGLGIRDTMKKQLVEAIQGALKKVTPKALATLSAHPRELGGVLGYSPLWFDSDGRLLVQSARGVIAWSSRAPEEEEEISEEVDPWPLTISSDATKERLLGLAFPCEHPEISLLRASEAGLPLAPIRTGLLAPRPGACGGVEREEPRFEFRPISFEGEEVAGFIGTHRIGERTQVREPGGAVSENGRYVVTRSSLGLLVQGGEKPELWSIPDARRVSGCVVHPNGKEVACVKAGRAVVFAAASD